MLCNFSGSSDYATDPVIVELKSFLVPEHQLLVFWLLLFFSFFPSCDPCLVCEQVIFFPVLPFPSFSNGSETVAYLGLLFNSVCCKIKLPLYIMRSM